MVAERLRALADDMASGKYHIGTWREEKGIEDAGVTDNGNALYRFNGLTTIHLVYADSPERAEAYRAEMDALDERVEELVREGIEAGDDG